MVQPDYNEENNWSKLTTYNISPNTYVQKEIPDLPKKKRREERDYKEVFAFGWMYGNFKDIYENLRWKII